MRTLELMAALVLIAASASAIAKTEAQDARELSGMAVIGNQELPKALYIVPWKSADMGASTPGPSSGLFSEALAPLDPKVFRRELNYYDAIQAAQ